MSYMSCSFPPSTNPITKAIHLLSRHAKGRVESIGSSLAGSRLSGLRGLLASLHRLRGSLARALQARARKVGNDADRLGRAVVEVGRVDVLEAGLLAAVEADGELDGRVAAAAKVERVDLAAGQGRAAEPLQVVGGAALVLLGLALLGAALELAGVGGVGARVLLHGARALDGSAGGGEGSAVDREGASRAGGALDRGRGTAEGAREGLDIDGAGGSAASASIGASIGASISTSISTSTSTSGGVVSRRGYNDVASYSAVSIDPFF